MILTDYYRFNHISLKSESRIDCTASTGGYNEFEQLRNQKGELYFYLGDVPEKFKSFNKADLALTKVKSLSSVYFVRKSPNIARGDMKGTTDGLILKICHDVVEIFVARGRKKDIVHLANLFADGELEEEIEMLKAHAKN